MQWWDLDLTSLFKGPQVDNGSALASYVDSDGVLTVDYIVSHDVHRLHLSPGAAATWNPDQNLTVAAATPPGTVVPSAVNGTALSSVGVDGNGVAHVFYVGDDDHVHQLYGSWKDQDLTEQANPVGPGGKVLPASGQALSSFVDGNDGARVFYIGDDDHVHQLSVNSSGAWADLDLTIKANGQIASAASGLASFVDTLDYYVFYIGTSVVRELFFNNVTVTSWVDQDPTGATKPQVSLASGLTGFVDAYGGHVFYVAINGHVHHMNFSGGTWVDKDLSGTASPDAPETTIPLAAGPLSSFGDPYGDHVLYIGGDQHVHQLYFANTPPWVDQDLTRVATPVVGSGVVSGVPPLAATRSALCSLADTNNLVPDTTIELVFYISADQHVHLLCYANQPVGWSSSIKVKCPPVGSVELGGQYNSGLPVPTGGVAPYEYTQVGLPGAQLNSSTGAITWTPTTTGTFPFTLTVTDETGATATAICSVVVTQQATLSIACPLTPAALLELGVQGEVGVPYSSNLVVSNAAAPYTCKITSGNLPPGLSLTPSTGAVAGTPSTDGTFGFRATVTDANGATAAASCAISIAPKVALSCPANGVTGQLYGPDLMVSGGASPSCNITSGNLPPGLSLTPSTGAIAGTPTTAGAFNFVATVNDPIAGTATITCVINIFPTFWINAVSYDTGATIHGPDGPQSGLTFAVAILGQPGSPVHTTASSTTPGLYEVTGVPIGTEIMLSASLVGQNFWICDASGDWVSQSFPVTSNTQLAPTTIIVALGGIPFGPQGGGPRP